MEEDNSKTAHPRYCSVRGCKYFYGTNEKSVHFFRPPVVNREIRAKWELLVAGNTSNSLRNIGRVCELHFRPEDIIKYKDRYSLRENAFPMLLEPLQEDPLAKVNIVDIESIKKNIHDTTAPSPLPLPSQQKTESPKQSNFCEKCIQNDVQLQAAKIRIAHLIAKVHVLTGRNRELKQRMSLMNKSYNVQIKPASSQKGKIARKSCSLCRTSIKLNEFDKHLCLNMETITCSFCTSTNSFTSTIRFLEHLSEHSKLMQQNASKGMLFKCDNCTVAYPMEIMLKCHQKIHGIPSQKLSKTSRIKRPVPMDEFTIDDVSVLPESLEIANLKQEQSEEIAAEAASTSSPMIKKFFKCGLCEMTFKLPTQLSAHLRVSHTQGHSEKQFQCYLCKIKLKSLFLLQKHMKEHGRNHSCKVCKVPLALIELKEHLCGDERSIKCEYCTLTFTNTSSLLEHLESHESKKQYRCDRCSKFWSMLILKEYHMKKHELDQPKVYNCPTCSKAFASSTSLANHKKVHSIERPYLCEECGKGFKTARNLTLHKMSGLHTDEPSIPCPDCPRKFYKNVDLKRHSYLHQENKYICEICHDEIATLSTYRKHIKRHSRTEADRKIQCSFCPMKFFCKKTASNHERGVHATRRLFKCEYCDVSYKYQGDLNKHRKTHLGEKPYQCIKCSKRFKYLTELQKHEFQHYKEEKKERND